MATEETPAWTKKDLLKLLAAMKTSISKRDKMKSFNRGMKNLDWNKVAFPPFSPEACQEKWQDTLRNMRRMRTLTELITEAENEISHVPKRNKVHPEPPKRPIPPNNIFYQENIVKYQEMYPQLKHTQLFKLINKKYKELPDEEKARYVEKFKLTNEEYKRKKLKFRREYLRTPVHECSEQQKRSASEDTPNGKQGSEDTCGSSEGELLDGLPLKPPANGYNLFCKEQLASMAGVSGRGYVSAWARQWRQLTEAKKGEYRQRCTQLNQQYSAQLNEYLSTLDEEEQQQVFDVTGIKTSKHLVRGEMEPVKTFPGEPKMAYRCGYTLFCKEQMEKLKSKFPKANRRLSEAVHMWQDLTTVEKDSYRKKSKENVKKYSTELQKWFETLTAEDQEEYVQRYPSKCQYLLFEQQIEVSDVEEPHQPSDSEDEDMEYSSSDEEDYYLNFAQEDEDDEESDDVAFDMH